MNLSTRAKFTLLVFAALGLLAVATGVFTSWRVREAVSDKLRENSANAVALAAANADDIHKSLFQRKVAQAMRVKETNRLEEETIRAFATADGDFFATLRRIALPPGFSILAVDDDLNILLRHGSFPDDFNPYPDRDIKGRKVGPTMLRLAKEGLPATALVNFAAPDGGAAMAFFGHHFYLPEKKLLIGVWTDIASQKQEERNEMAKAVATLATTFGSIRLGSSGFLMAINEDGSLAIAPNRAAALPEAKAINPLSGRTFLDDVRLAAESPDKSFYAEAPWLGNKRTAVIFVQRVRSMHWYVIGAGFVNEIEDTGRRLSLSLSLAILVIAAGMTLAAALMVGRLTKPLVQLAAFARQVPKTDFLQDSGGNHLSDELCRRPSRDEIGELARALSFMDDALRARVRELLETSGKRERMEGELHAATRIQMGFLPSPIPDGLVGGRFRLAAELIPAREVGGDLYDFFMLDKNRLCVVIGDVSDKGVPAALFMSMAMVLLRSAADTAEEPEHLLNRINRSLSRDNASDMFVTLFVAVVDLRNGEMCYANGGHNPPLIVSASGIRRLDDVAGPLVGVFEKAEFPGGKTVLRPGEALFLYTDGVSEAMNAANVQYGEATLEKNLLACQEEEPGEMIRRIHASVVEHAAGAPMSDDLTMLCLRVP